MSLPCDVLDRINAAVVSLPVLTAQDVPDSEDTCPICLTSFSSIFLDKDPEAGVTKIEACNHIFCRQDLVQWIQTQHGNCPTCRKTFLDIRLPSESDDESSDGGEYVPDEDYDDEDDEYWDTDGFSDADAMFNEWGDSASYVESDMGDVYEELDDQTGWGLLDVEQPYGVDGALDGARVGAPNGSWCAEARQERGPDGLEEM